MVQVNDPTPDLSDDELVTLQLKEQNQNSDFAPMLTLPKGKVNKNNFEECMKSSKPIAPIPSGSIEQVFNDKGPPEGTTAHQVLGTRSRFNYRNVLGELMYVYITCRPDMGYAITTTSVSSVQVTDPTPVLSDDELVTLQLKEQNQNSDFAPMLTLPKGKVNEITLKNV